ncbi:MAG: UTP--glucose-1-phosphate uridylyltransferase, partial [Solirubrobacterales bacterium]|nr:UTP--glucose-1-phosphate uridylyltransferase [Solirubrobacterales bacterium]
MSKAIEESESKLIADRAAQPVIDSFLRFQRLAEAGGAGTIAEASILPVDSLPDAAELPDGCPADLLDATVMIKLNGGLGTGMGMTRAKSLIEAKDGLSFLDIIARQVLDVRERTGARMPLMLMNSFATQADTLAALRKYPSLAVEGLGIDFLQNRVPKLRADNLRPVDWPADRELEWAPPGHGDLYTSLLASGSLDALRKQGFRYAFVSNADNLGAVLDDRILNWFASERIPFLIEAADRTEADRKGGHLARTPDGRLLLREIAQTADADVEAFQDIARHRFFNTNSIWLDLDALTSALDLGGGVLDLPMIINQKTVDPADPESTAVIQFESAMGAAIALFDGADAIRVPRSRFAPV